jgi:hypothetical protein
MNQNVDFTGFEPGSPWWGPHSITQFLLSGFEPQRPSWFPKDPHSPTEFLFSGPDPNRPRYPRPGISPFSVAFLVSAVSSKVAAAHMTNKEAAQRIATAADQAIAGFIDSDDICPRWPYPGPPPWLSIIASELTLVANTVQEGSLRAGILQVAGQVLDRVALNPQPLPP